MSSFVVTGATLSDTARMRERQSGPASWFLRLLPPDDARHLEQTGKRQHAAGDVLCREGDSSREVHLVTSGRIKIVTDTLLGRPVLLALCGPGQIIGEQAMLEEKVRSASAIALVPTETLAISSERLRALLRSHPPLALGMLAQMSSRLRDADRKRGEFAELDSSGRVARRLVELAADYGQCTASGWRIDLGLTQEEIASWVGASREALLRALASFRREGWITTGRRHITIVDLTAMSLRGRTNR